MIILRCQPRQGPTELSWRFLWRVHLESSTENVHGVLNLGGSTTSTNIAGFARFYSTLGLNIIPLRQGEKRPLFKWEQYQRRVVTQEELTAWFGAEQPHNMGIVCGKVRYG